MATFPKLIGFLNPWKKTRLLFMSGESVSTGAESLPKWKDALNLKVEQANLTPKQEEELKVKIKEWKSSKEQGQDMFEAKIRLEIAKEELANRSGEKYGDITNELETKNQPIVYLEDNEGHALSNQVAQKELVPGAELTVDYGINNPAVNQARACQAERRIGLKHMFANAPQVTKIEVTQSAARGGLTLTLLRCADGKYREETKLKEKRSFPVYQDYTVKVIEIGGKTEDQQIAAEVEAVKREDADLVKGAEALQAAQKAEATSTHEVTAEEMAKDRRSALEMAGVYGPKPTAAPIETSLNPDEEKAFLVQRDLLQSGITTLSKALFVSDKKGDDLTAKCSQEIVNKKFKSISVKPETAQGEMQEITLTLVDKKGVEHVYKGASNQPIGENAFVKDNLPPIAPGAETVKAYYWNKEAFKELIKDIAKQAGGEIPHPNMDSPYANGVIYGGVRAAGTNGEEGSSETYVPSNMETGNARLSPNAETGPVDINQIQSLKAGEGARLPDAMKTWTVRDFEANRYRVDHMDQFWDSLQVLAKQSGQPAMGILKPFLDGNKITYQELCRQTLGRTPQRVWDDYEEARAGVAEQKDFPAQHPGQAAPGDNAPSKVKKTDRIGEVKDEYYTYGDLKDLVAKRDDFFVASYRLLEATRILEKNNAAIRTDALGEFGKDNTEVKNTQVLIASIFNPTDQAPIAKRTLWEALTRDKNEFEATMYQTQRSYLMGGENAYESSISSAGAYAQILGEFTNGETVNYEGLAGRLTQMRAAGKLYYDIMGAKDQVKLKESLAEKWSCTPEEVATRLASANNKEAIKAGDLKNNPSSALNQADILLIQLGMIPQEELVESTQESVMQRGMLKKVEAEAAKGVAESVTALNEAQKKYTNKSFTPEEIKTYEATVLSKMCVRMNENGQFGLAFADMNHDFKGDQAIGYSRELLSVPVGEKGKLSISAGVGVGFISGLTVLDGVSAGISVVSSQKFGAENQNTASISIGASAGIGHAEVGVMGSVKLKGKADASTNQPKVWYFKAGIGAVAGVGLEHGIASITVANIEIGRDLDAAARMKYLKLKEANPKFTEELNGYVDETVSTYQTQIDANTAGMSQVEKDQYLHTFRASVAQLYIKERGEEAITEMFPIQFGKIGVAAGIGVTGPIAGFLVPYFGIEFKGRKIVRYMKPDGAKMDDVAEAKFREQLAAETKDDRLGQVVYRSGDLTMNEAGERSLEGSLIKFEQARNLETLNAKLASQGMELAPGEGGKLRIKVKGVDGFVNIYVDPTSNIQASRGDDKNAYLNLDFLDSLSVLRVDNYTAFKQGGGGVKNVDIYITNNPEKSLTSIKDRSGDRLTWRQTDIYPASATNPDGSSKNTLEDTMHVKRTAYIETTAAYKSQAEMLAANPTDGLGDFNNTEARSARETLQAEILKVMGSTETVEGESHVQALDHYVEALIASHTVDYMKLTSDATVSKDIITAAETKMGIKLNADERTYLLQNLLVKSRANTPGSPEAMSKHILGWNTRALDAFCNSHAVPAGTAKAIMDAYDRKLGAALAGNLPSTQMETGYQFQTLIGQGEIGTLGRGINSKLGSGGLAGMEAVTVSNLETSFGLTSAQAEAFMTAQLKEFRYMSNSTAEAAPLARMKSPLGIALMEQATGLFSIETAQALKTARESGTIDINATYWKEYSAALTGLEGPDGTYVSPTGHVLVRHQAMVMGLLESCRNFTVAAKETIETRDTTAVHAVDTHEGLNGNIGNNFTSVDAAVAGTPEKPKKPPRHRHPKDEGEKEPDGDVTDGNEDTAPGDDNSNDVPPEDTGVTPPPAEGSGNNTPGVNPGNHPPVGPDLNPNPGPTINPGPGPTINPGPGINPPILGGIEPLATPGIGQILTPGVTPPTSPEV